MGDDSVIECIVQGNNIMAHSSWNTNSFGNTRQGVVSQELYFMFENCTYLWFLLATIHHNYAQFVIY